MPRSIGINRRGTVSMLVARVLRWTIRGGRTSGGPTVGGENNIHPYFGVWLLCPLADCPPDRWSSMDELLFVLSRQWMVHCYNSSPACKRHPTDSPSVVRPLDHLGPRVCALPHACSMCVSLTLSHRASMA